MQLDHLVFAALLAAAFIYGMIKAAKEHGMEHTESELRLAFGYNKGIPADAQAVWGARLIWPDDLVWDRQDLVTKDEASKEVLIDWLNKIGISKMRENLRMPYTLGLHPIQDIEAVIYEDEIGKIIGNSNASAGYIYVVGWLK